MKGFQFCAVEGAYAEGCIKPSTSVQGTDSVPYEWLPHSSMKRLIAGSLGSKELQGGECYSSDVGFENWPIDGTISVDFSDRLNDV